MKTYDHDPADFLETEEDYAGYLTECIKLDEGDVSVPTSTNV